MLAKLTKYFLLITLALLSLVIFPTNTYAQTSCSFYPMGPALNDLGPNEYYRISYLPGGSRFNQSTWFYVRQAGITGGLYPNGSNVMPLEHQAAGLSIASQITPLDANGDSNSNGKIGVTSIGMSNTNSEFGNFMSLAHGDPEINSKIKLVNGAMGGGVIERWTDETSPYYEQYWSQLEDKIVRAGLTDAQMQVAWIKVTQFDYQPNFPEDMHNLENMYGKLLRLLKAKFPNLKMAYFSSRVRSFSYFGGLSPEPSAFENGFAVKWIIERQINGDPTVNYDPNNGTVVSPWIAWGPYMWADGLNPRSDGLTWQLSYVQSGDCTHPTSEGNSLIASMLMQFFKSDSTSTPWFLAPGVPTPTPTPTTTITPTVTPTPTLSTTPTPTTTVTLTPTLTPTVTVTPTLTSTPTVTPTPMPTGTPPMNGLISSWGFASSAVTDDINGCLGCSNNNATWFSDSVISGGYNFNGVDSYLNLGDFQSVTNRSAFTFSVWVKPDFDQTSSTWRYVFVDGSTAQLFYLGQNHYWRFTVRTNAANYRIDTSNISWTSGTWHNIAISYDGTQIKIYWDGQLANPNAVSATGVVVNDTAANYLGRMSSGNYFDGSIDEVKVYDHALNSTEINQLYLTR